ncbi:NUDIX domain-containing protein [Kocuria flava]|uniref:NUDIX hydrolase n=1 Tax=Kocuria flava TaxID=446860 RepID=UPI001FF3DC9F|nr:NUDIX domain-containing protein [Kocuria flava]MCJ8504234.1 NUDIX domain-containing protein [Kocuria flava]
MRTVRAAAAVVLDERGRLLLVRRGRAPQRGRWTLPGGALEPGETVAGAAVREVLEETGLRVRVLRELGTVRVPAGEDLVYEVHDVEAVACGGTLWAGDDAAAVRWAAPGELAGLATTDGLIGHLVRFGVLPPDPAGG